MVYFFKSTFFVLAASLLVFEQQISTDVLLGILVLMASNLFREKFRFAFSLVIGEALLLYMLTPVNPIFWTFYGLVVFDLMRLKSYVLMAVFLGVSVVSMQAPMVFYFLFVQGICGVFGLSVERYQGKVADLLGSYDRERQIRYNLEETKRSLLRASGEQAHLAELRERNRIARELHDNLGHALAGVFLQVQAAQKLQDVDKSRAAQLFQQSISRLGGSMDLLRDIVHNLHPSQKLDQEYIQEVVDKFEFCPVKLETSGDWQSVPALYLELVATNIKEALTNAAKYSKASQILVRIEITPTYIRLYIKDNGVGCQKVRPGMGLGGMLDRVHGVNGNLSISGEDGFMIVCFLPMQEGRGVLAGANR